MEKPEIILIGGGGHCKSCIDVIETEGRYHIQGILDIKENVGKELLGYTIIGTDDDIPDLVKKEFHFLITIGQITSNEIRIRIFNSLKSLNAILPVIISPDAYVSKHSLIKAGTIIMHHAVINASVVIGENCIINNKSLIEHDAQVGNNCHVAPGAILNGNVRVGNGSFIGSGSVTKQGVIISENSFIKANCLIKENL
jgi:sugar O-acyltransferase (sialic acid O-acetyltransferase NeuD family)